MKYNIITIEREFASGGSEIGIKLSEKLGIPCYGREILLRVAEKYEVLPEQLASLEEVAVNSVLYSLVMSTKIVTGERSGLSDEGALYLAESRVIKQMADEGRCIIVGRGANHVLKERKDVLNVFIRSDMEFRKQRAIELYREKPENVKAVLKKYDKKRSNFYSANSTQKWDDMSEYHIVLDSGKLGIDACVEIINSAAVS